MCLLIVVMWLSLLAVSAAGANSIPSGFELVSESDHAELYMKWETAEIALRTKSDGAVWFSNPPDRVTMETLTRGAAKDKLLAQIVISYYSMNQKLEMDSYNDCIKHGQFEIAPIPGGVRVDYELGRRWQDEDCVPQMISEERFNNLVLANIESEKDRKYVRDQYILFTLEEGYVDADEFSIFGVDLDALLGPYGLKVGETGMRATDKRRVLQEYLVRIRDTHGYTGLGEIKTEDIEVAFGVPVLMQKWTLMPWDTQALVEHFKGAGYTPEDAQIDHEMVGISPPWPDLRNFKISVEYVLDGADLVARIPSGSVTYPVEVYDPKVERVMSYPLTSISLLPYFGAANTNSEGYILVPEGPGALVYLNNGKTTVETYGRRVYGRDYSTMPVTEYATTLKGQIHLPVYGLKNGDNAFLAIIEDGDALAQIAAVVAGMRDSYNRVWATFDFIPSARVNLQSDDSHEALRHLRQLAMMMYQSRSYLGDVTVRYCFLSGEDADYSGMAGRYREYLVDGYNLSRIETSEGLPLVLEIIGSFDMTKPVFGFPVNSAQAATTYEQADEIVMDLLNSGIDDILVRYRGWLKGGLNHVYPDRMVIERQVGSVAGLRQFLASAGRERVEVFPDVGFLLVHRNSLFDGFVTYRDAARFLSRKSGYIAEHSLASHQVDAGTEKPILSPRRLPSLIESFMKDYSQLDVGGIALTYMGQQLNSDFRVNPEELVDRQQAKKIVTDQARLMADLGLDVMVTGGNAYMLPYTKYVVNAPMYSVGIALLDSQVPFYHMAVSGHIVRAGAPANLSDITGEQYLLRMLETGCAPYFVVTYSPSSDMKNTRHDYLYATTFAGIRDNILGLYNEVAGISGNLWSQKIIDHEVVMPEVFRTTYEDGTTIIVNYRATPVEVNGVSVLAEDYLVIAGGVGSAR